MTTKKLSKKLNKKELGQATELDCPRCDKLALQVDKNDEVYCENCKLHLSPIIFRRLIKGE